MSSTNAETKAVNLFTSLYLGLQEEPTSRILTYFWEKFPPTRAALLTLLECPANPDHTIIRSNYPIHISGKGKADGFVDCVFQNDEEKYIVFVENKPRPDSSFTYAPDSQEADQLKRYAIALDGDKFRAFKKTLCLLATEKNKDELLKSAADAEGASIAGDEKSLKEYYAQKGINFIVITWQKVLTELGKVLPKDAVRDFLVEELNGYLFPPEIKLLPEDTATGEAIEENWEKKIIPVVAETIKYLCDKMPGKSSRLEVNNYKAGQTGKGASYRDNSNFGLYILDNVHDIWYWVGVDKGVWKRFRCAEQQKHYLFVVRVGWNKKYPPQYMTITESQTFLQDVHGNPEHYFCSLTDATSGDGMLSEALGEKIIATLNGFRNILAKN